MSLTTEDLQAIKGLMVGVVNEAIEQLVNPRFDELEDRLSRFETDTNGRLTNLETAQQETNRRLKSLESAQRETNERLTAIEPQLDRIDGKLSALYDDVKELYKIAGRLEHSSITDRKFAKLPATKKLLTIHAELLSLAQPLDVTLPA